MRSSDLVPLWFLLGCPPDDPPPHDDTATPNEEFACTLGFYDIDHSFAAATEGSTAELVLGFQGFLFLDVGVEADRGGTDFVATGAITPDGDPMNGSSQPEVSLVAEGDHWRTDSVLVFLPSGNVSAYAGRSAALALRLENDEAWCATSLTVELVDEDPCIHTDQEPICPKDSGGGG